MRVSEVRVQGGMAKAQAKPAEGPKAGEVQDMEKAVALQVRMQMSELSVKLTKGMGEGMQAMVEKANQAQVAQGKWLQTQYDNGMQSFVNEMQKRMDEQHQQTVVAMQGFREEMQRQLTKESAARVERVSESVDPGDQGDDADMGSAESGGSRSVGKRNRSLTVEEVNATVSLRMAQFQRVAGAKLEGNCLTIATELMRGEVDREGDVENDDGDDKV